MPNHDVAVVGLGPAGRALAHRLAAHGARVLAVDPHPGRHWPATYGGWIHDLPPWLDGGVIGARSPRTEIVAHARHRLLGEYVVLDNDRLHQALPLDGVDVQERRVAEHELIRLAPTVVDCRGNTRALASARTPVQQAHGRMLDPEACAGLLGEATGILMDWRPHDGSRHWGARTPSFCYVVPLPDGRVLAEETCLAGRPALDDAELAGRLSERLDHHGVDAARLAAAQVERVHIAMLPPPGRTRGVLRFGAAGPQVNPITGYSVFASLAAADDLAGRLATGRAPVRTTSVASGVRRAALEALLGLDAEGTVDLFDAFARMPADRQRAVLDPAAPAPELLTALGRQWWLMPPSGRRALVAATTRSLLP